MNNNDITFEQAFSYLYNISKYINIAAIARKTKISRTTYSACFNGTKNKYGNPNLMPVKHHQTIIDLAKFIKSGIEIKKDDSQN